MQETDPLTHDPALITSRKQAIIIEESLPPASNSGSVHAELSTKVYRSVSKRKACLTTKYLSEKGYLGGKNVLISYIIWPVHVVILGYLSQ